MIVVDASVVIPALADDGADGDLARSRLRGERLVAPHLLDLEVVSAWRRIASTGAIDERRARQALDDLQALRVRRVPHGPMVDRCWQLRANLSVYDAAYVALAELLGITLVTADRKLADAPGPRCPVELLA